jgi:predicted aldo/keto reductase-like oxidoreductase
MNYRTNLKNGDKLSILGFGCMRFAGDDLGASFVGGSLDTQKVEV